MGRDNRGMAAHSGRMFDCTQTPSRHSVKARQQNGHSSTEQPCSQNLQNGIVCLDAGSPGKTGSRPVSSPGCTGRRSALFRGKRGVQAVNRRPGGHKEGEKPHYCTQQGWLGRHLSGKQPVKDSGVCRVIGPSPGEADVKSRILRAEKAESSRISLRAYRKKPRFSTPLCLISAISAPDHWCIGRVAISGTQSDVCVRRGRDTPSG